MNKRNQILVTLSTFGAYSNEPYNVLKKSGFAFQSNTSGKRMIPEDVLRLGQNCMGIIAGVEEYSSELLSKLPNLCCISRCGSGIDNINLTEAKKRKIVILNTPDSPTIAVAELTLSMILSLLRQLPKVNSLMHERMWQRVSGNLLAGKVVGIIGLGRIG
ncbi:MAG: hypothetical protein GY855_10130, partial [candidate division Zixibacteria bacterium]|nr:hypothetical protein [candidate division Zixibacteria bacterium]